MSELAFTRTGNTIVVAELAGQIDTALSISGTVCRADASNIWASHASISEANRTAIQAVIDAYVPDPTHGMVASYVFTIVAPPGVTWTNMPAALTEAVGTQTKLPLFNAAAARLTCDVKVAGATNAILIGQLSLDGSNWVNGPQVPIGSTGLKVSPLVVIGATYQKDVFFRIAGQDGNGTADPQFGLVTLQVAQ